MSVTNITHIWIEVAKNWCLNSTGKGDPDYTYVVKMMSHQGQTIQF